MTRITSIEALLFNNFACAYACILRVRVSLTNSLFLSLSLCHDTCTSTQEDVGSSEEECMDDEEEEPEKNAVCEEDILSQVGPFQVPQHHEIIPLSILGSDQQNLEKILEDFKWAGYRLAHVLADGESTASHKRQWRCWRFPQGQCFFIAKTLSKRLCTRYCWTNMVCRRGG